ncbi:MAG: hypothetical protein NC132_06210 [Corallococcus sp.]|nr:hypothetical protein [Corallococcus sp.]MCM1359798.1 hypothetical protein [Corallococcus sp.]MCM1395676.1 hypothetical protein [Corallococcus sp.]
MKNELAYFTDSVNRLIEGKMILVDKNIASVLKCVASTPVLCKCLSDSLRSVSYVTEFSRARVTWTRPDGTVDARLKLPAERNRLFAFVVCLLTEVDCGRRNILEFLKEYYNDADSNVAYERFATEVLKPFKHAGESILHSVDPSSLNLEESVRAEKFFTAEKTYVASDVLAALLKETDTVTAIFQSADSLLPYLAEVLTLCEFFVNALYLKNPKILCISWLALRNFLLRFNSLQENTEQISELMSQIRL